MPNLLKDLLGASPILLALAIVAIDRYKRHISNKKSLPHKVVCDKLDTWHRGMDAWTVSMHGNIFVEGELDNILYGEITYDAMKSLAKKLALTKDDVFYDLGSGAGKFVTYMYLATPIKKSVGIEMAGKRHKIAMRALEQLKAEGLMDKDRELTFIHNNIRQENFSDATVIFMSSLCFSNALMEELNQKFVQLKPGLRIISLQTIPKHPQLAYVEEEFLPMSWANTSMVYHYKLLSPQK